MNNPIKIDDITSQDLCQSLESTNPWCPLSSETFSEIYTLENKYVPLDIKTSLAEFTFPEYYCIRSFHEIFFRAYRRKDKTWRYLYFSNIDRTFTNFQGKICKVGISEECIKNFGIATHWRYPCVK